MERFKKFDNARKSRRTAQLRGWIAKGGANMRRRPIAPVRRTRREVRRSARLFLNIAFG